jgi:site-specific recombinase XerD
MTMSTEQLPLFGPAGAKPKPSNASAGEPLAALGPLTADSSLTAAIGVFHDRMQQLGMAQNTIQAFAGDLNILRQHLGPSIALNDITGETLHGFLRWLKYDRGVPCKPKSFQRRLTTLKVFFAWLVEAQILDHDPAAPIAHQPVSSPLPTILYPDQVDKLLNAARELRDSEKQDVRPYLLVTLLLSTGIKKSETMALRLTDIDLSNAKQPVLYIRYDDAKKRHKERKLKLAEDFGSSLAAFKTQYHPRENLFECTARNLEYVLADLAQATGLGDTVSFEGLRWTCAVHDYQSGMAEDQIRLKLGLSTITWEEAGDKLRRLAGKPL